MRIYCYVCSLKCSDKKSPKIKRSVHDRKRIEAKKQKGKNYAGMFLNAKVFGTSFEMIERRSWWIAKDRIFLKQLYNIILWIYYLCHWNIHVAETYVRQLVYHWSYKESFFNLEALNELRCISRDSTDECNSIFFHLRQVFL